MIPHNLPTLGPEEQEAASRVLAGAWVAQGAEVEAFENEPCHSIFGIPADLPNARKFARASIAKEG